MKRTKIFYWIATILLALLGTLAGFTYLTSPVIAAEFKHLGFPDYFRIELAIAKFLGVTAILLPMIPQRIKEWAYAGFAVAFISAIIAHTTVEGITAAIIPIISTLILFTSYGYYVKLSNYKKAV